MSAEEFEQWQAYSILKNESSEQEELARRAKENMQSAKGQLK